MTRKTKLTRPWLPATLTLLAAVWLSSCTSTVTPPTVHDSVPSWDGANQNSGFLEFDARGYGVLTPRARDRYNALVDEYGGRMTLRLYRDDGITPTTTNTFLIDPEHLSDFLKMNRWKKQGQ